MPLHLLALLIPLNCWTQEQPLYMDTRKPTVLQFESPSWNKNASQAEQRTIYLRNKKTGEVSAVQLIETSANSGIFAAEIRNPWSNTDPFATPEIYLGDRNASSSPESVQKMKTRIEQGYVSRKPFFLEPTGAGQSIVVYESKAQAFENFARYTRTQSEKRELEESLARAAEAAEREKAKALEEERLRKLEIARKATEEAERLKREELLRQQKELDEKTRQARREQARKLAEDAMQAYQTKNFKKAEELFEKSIALDPANTKYWFQYGVSAYQNGNYTKSLALLKLAESGEFNPVERDYYKGLCFFKMRELNQAENTFASLLPAGDPKLSPSAAFLLGVVRFQKENYAPAKDAFEWVLDNSQDPDLDRQAENYIEQIGNIQSFLERQKKPWTLTLNAGLMSDSNILSAATGTATDMGGYRLSYGASLDYRYHYKEKSEGSLRFNMADLNSVTNTKFQYNDTFQRYDPLVTTLSAPMKFRSKTVQWSLTPAYEMIHMDVDGISNTETLTQSYALRKREMIVSSWYLKTDASWIMSPRWMSTPSVEIRRDNSLIASTEDEDQKAWKYTLNWSNAFFLNDKLSMGHVADVGASQNQAVGVNQRYLRYDLSYTWFANIFKESGYSARFNYGSANYAQSTTSRKDTQMNLSLSLRTPLSKKWFWNNTLSYTSNASNVDTYKYTRLMLQSSFEWTTLF